LHIFPHYNKFLMCWYFALGYKMILDDDPRKHMFPQFAANGKAARGDEGDDDEEDNGNNNKNKKDKNKNKKKGASEYSNCKEDKKTARESLEMAKQFRNMINVLLAEQENLRMGPLAVGRELRIGLADEDEGDDDEAGEQGAENRAENAEKPIKTSFVKDVKFDGNLSSHSHRKLAINKANDAVHIKTSWVCFRAGWLMKAVHTIFDYIGGNRNNDAQVGLALAGWNTIDCVGRLCGGRPPRVNPDFVPQTPDEENPIPNSKQIDEFMSHLFCKYEQIEGANNRDLQEMALASILRFLPDVVKLICEHPGRKYGTEEKEV